MTAQDDRPRADRGREQVARETFPVNEMSPEEYAARHGVDWASFLFDEFEYSDPALEHWIQRLGKIFRTPGELARCQQQLLSPEELERVRARAQEPF